MAEVGRGPRAVQLGRFLRTRRARGLSVQPARPRAAATRSVDRSGRGNVGLAVAFAAARGDLVDFTAELLTAIGIAETPDETRLREPPAISADVGCGYRLSRRAGAVHLIAYASLSVFITPGESVSEVLAVRYIGLKHKSVSPALRIAGPAATQRARSSAPRSASPTRCPRRCLGVLPRTAFELVKGRRLNCPANPRVPRGEHLAGWLDQLAGAAGIVAPEFRSSSAPTVRESNSMTPLRVAAEPHPLPCLMARAFSPNSLRLQPFSAGTSRHRRPARARRCHRRSRECARRRRVLRSPPSRTRRISPTAPLGEGPRNAPASPAVQPW